MFEMSSILLRMTVFKYASMFGCYFFSLRMCASVCFMTNLLPWSSGTEAVASKGRRMMSHVSPSANLCYL